MRIFVALGLLGLLAPAPGLAETLIRIAVLRVDVAGLPPISRLDLPPADLGLAGGHRADEDRARAHSRVEADAVRSASGIAAR